MRPLGALLLPKDSDWCHGEPASLPSLPALCISCVLLPAIRILHTPACLIRVSQRKRQTKPLLLSLQMSSPSQRLSRFLSASLARCSQIDHREMVLIDLLKPTHFLAEFQGLSCDRTKQQEVLFSKWLEVSAVQHSIPRCSYLCLHCVCAWQ